MKLKRLAGKFFLGVVATFYLAQPSVVQAASHTWSGVASGNWSFAGNWSSGGVPAAGEANLVLVFPGSGVSRFLTTNNIAGLTVQSIQLNGNGYHLYGNSITLAAAASGTNISTPSAGIGSFLHLPIVVPVGSFGVSVGTFATLEIQSALSGSGELNNYGGGLLRLNGSSINSFTGTFRQHKGEVALGKTSGAALSGPVYVGLPTSTSQVKLSYEANHQIADASDVYVQGKASFLMLEGFNDTIHSLNLVGGEMDTFGGVNFTTGELAITGNVTADDSETSPVTEPHISGRMNLGNAQRTFTVPGTQRLLVSAELASSGTNGGITLTGGGDLQLMASNSFSGPLRIQMGQVFGMRSSAFGSAVGATVLEGGRLFIGKNCFIAAEPLEVKESSYLWVQETNWWNGPILVQTNAELHVEGYTSSFFGDRLSLGGVISGPGKMSYLIDRVIFTGFAANTLSGGHRVRGNTTVTMASISNALTGPISIEDAYGSWPPFNWANDHQIGDSSSLTWTVFSSVQNPGALNLNGFSDVVGSLSGKAPANINCGTGKLTVGGNNLDCEFSGTISGSGSGTNLIKSGSGMLVLSGSHSIVGKTVVSGGSLILSNAIGVGPVHVSSGILAGAGPLGALTAGGSGIISPGLQPGASSYGALQPASFSPGGGYLSMALGGSNAGVDHDQIVTSAALNLNGTALLLSALPLPHGSNSFTLINVTNAGQVTGKFVGLPEGEIFPSSDGKLFRITYQGGNGNDVVVTRYYTQPIAAILSGIVRLPDGRMRVSGTGLVETVYQVQANTNLNTTNWVVVGSVVAGDEFGTLEFVDNNAANFPMRFYRFVLP